MANFVYDYGAGRGVELYNRVKSADPATAAFLVVLFASAGQQTDANMRPHATLAAVTAANTEATNTGYARKVLVAADLAALPNPDTTNHWWQLIIADQVWTTVANDGSGALGRIGIFYRPATASADSACIPLTFHDFVGTPGGGSVTADIGANGFIRCATS